MMMLLGVEDDGAAAPYKPNDRYSFVAIAGGLLSRAHEILRAASSVLVIDWPSRDVPDTLARAGFEVYVAGGPGAYSVVDLVRGQVVNRRVDGCPDLVDLVYSHRPIAELPRNLEMAKQLRALAVWRQSGVVASGERDARGCWVSDQESNEARAIVESAGLKYVDDAYIADTARELGIRR